MRPVKPLPPLIRDTPEEAKARRERGNDFFVRRFLAPLFGINPDVEEVEEDIDERPFLAQKNEVPQLGSMGPSVRAN